MQHVSVAQVFEGLIKLMLSDFRVRDGWISVSYDRFKYGETACISLMIYEITSSKLCSNTAAATVDLQIESICMESVRYTHTYKRFTSILWNEVPCVLWLDGPAAPVASMHSEQPCEGPSAYDFRSFVKVIFT